MTTISPYTAHVNKWKNCTLCPLHETRHKVVLARGKIPADILFIGEAPGASENALGQPFIGPAGKLLDSAIEHVLDAMLERGKGIRIAFTNIISCIPLDDDGIKVSKPPKEAIIACKPRLYEMIAIAKPKVIVLVGEIAEKNVVATVPTNMIVHPAAILRADKTLQPLMKQTLLLTLKDIFEEFYETQTNS